jgi:hypothetical protein
MTTASCLSPSDQIAGATQVANFMLWGRKKEGKGGRRKGERRKKKEEERRKKMGD